MRRYLSVFALLLAVFTSTGSVYAQDEPDGSEEAVAAFNAGQEAHEKGDLLGAIRQYEKALEIFPEFPEAELQRGSAFLSLGKIDEAERSFRRASELREDWSLALASLGSVLVRKDQFDEAETILARAIELDDRNFPAYAAMADLRLRTGAGPDVLKELLVKLRNLSSKASPTASVLASRAAIENKLGDRAAAKRSLDQALSIDPANRNALSGRAVIALSEGDIDRAEKIAKTLNEGSPASDEVKFLLAQVAFAKSGTGEALKILDTIPTPSFEIKAFRSRITMSGSDDAAELEAALAKDNKNAGLLARLCSAFRTRDPAKALEYCRRASEADPENINHAVGYGAALVQAKAYTQAVELLRRILVVAPDNYTAHTNLATALSQLKRYGEAKTEYQWLIDKQPDLVIAYYLIGIAHDQLEEYMDAAANYQIFLRKADKEKNRVEIEKVNLRMPVLQKLIKEKKGKK